MEDVRNDSYLGIALLVLAFPFLAVLPFVGLLLAIGGWVHVLLRSRARSTQAAIVTVGLVLFGMLTLLPWSADVIR